MGLKSQRIQESDCGLSTYLMTASNGKVQAYRWALGSVSHLRLFWNKLTLGLHAQSQGTIYVSDSHWLGANAEERSYIDMTIYSLQGKGTLQAFV